MNKHRRRHVEEQMSKK